jgi:hypothetical protein
MADTCLALLRDVAFSAGFRAETRAPGRLSQVRLPMPRAFQQRVTAPMRAFV